MNGASPTPVGIHGILARMEVLIVAAVAAPMLLFGWAAWSGVSGLRGRLLSERRAVAATVAHHVDRTLQESLELLAAIPVPRAAETGASDEAAVRAALRETYLRSRLLEGAMVVDASGRVLWAEPSRDRTFGFELDRVPEAADALRTGRPAVSRVVTGPTDPPRVYALVPLGTSDGRVETMAVGVWSVGSPAWTDRLETSYLDPAASVDYVGSDGTVVMSSVPARRFRPSDHAAAAAEALAAGSAEVRALRAPGGDSEIVALAPLKKVPWVVTLREPESSFLGAVLRIHRWLVPVGALIVALAVVFAWGISRSVREPLAALAEASERIASGDIRRPIDAPGDDEIGRLGRSFETMRRALEESMERITRANQDLERRVEERTRELRGLYSELNLRDQMRGRLLRKVIHAQEEERKRIARELHDETCQTITALSMRIDTALRAADPDEARARLGDVKGMASRTLDELHRVIFDLRPSILDDLGLVPALRWYAQKNLAPRGIQVRFEADEIERHLPPEIEIAVFRAAQEALNNVVRHAGAESVLVQVAAVTGRLEIEIEDDGRGFDVAEVAGPSDSGRGLGILGIRERLELLGGSAGVESSPGQGTRVTLSVPLPPEGQGA